MLDLENIDQIVLERLQKPLKDEIESVHIDVHPAVVDYLAPDIINRLPISAARPLNIDKRDRRHLYLMSAVPLTLFYDDLAGQLANTAQAAFTFAAGKFQELPFQTGDRLLCPQVAASAEIIVYLLASQQVLAL